MLAVQSRVGDGNPAYNDCSRPDGGSNRGPDDAVSILTEGTIRVRCPIRVEVNRLESRDQKREYGDDRDEQFPRSHRLCAGSEAPSHTNV